MTRDELIETMARAVRECGNCGFQIGGERVFCDNVRLEHDERLSSCGCKASAEASLSAIEAAGYAVLEPGIIHPASYKLGMKHLNDSIQSFKAHCDFGPAADADFGLQQGVNSLKSVSARVVANCDRDGYFDRPAAATEK